jgi:hypothetical protein
MSKCAYCHQQLDATAELEGERRLSSAISRDCNATALERNKLQSELHAAIEALRDIAALRVMSKRQRVISERAITWLSAHGYALEEGGYIPGVGFKDKEI